MADDILDSAWLKWERAVAHSETLQADMIEWSLNPESKRGVTVSTRYEPKRHCFVVYARTVPVLPKRWGVILGDIAHNYRSCLDNLAWALGTRKSLTRKQRKAIYFPVARDRISFNNALIDRPKPNGGTIYASLPGLNRTEVAKIRRFQPYKRGQTNVPRHVFAVLSTLSNNDKHRAIHPIVALPDGAVYEVTYAQRCTVTRMPQKAARKKVEVGAELTCVYVRRTGADPKLKVKGMVSAQPAINENIWVHDWLTETRDFTFRLLSEFGEPPVGF